MVAGQASIGSKTETKTMMVDFGRFKEVKDVPKGAARASIAVTLSTDTNKRGGGRKIGLNETAGLEAVAALVDMNGVKVKSQKAIIKLGKGIFVAGKKELEIFFPLWRSLIKIIT